jgi:hypothetical protein
MIATTRRSRGPGDRWAETSAPLSATALRSYDRHVPLSPGPHQGGEASVRDLDKLYAGHGHLIAPPAETSGARPTKPTDACAFTSSWRAACRAPARHEGGVVW